jgi:predicted short-subunit dehydrogenase-like oxidoreductase (DUF2520 family)
LSLAFAARDAGHVIAAVVGRDRDHALPAADDLGVAAHGIEARLPEADLAVIAVRDSAIEPVAGMLAANDPSFAAAVHVSGLVPVDALNALRVVGVRTGSFHPLQTLPNASAGARRLPGAGIAITGEDDLVDLLFSLATSIGAKPFFLGDEAKPLYHAAAAAASNFPIVTLAMARDLFEAAGVEFSVARPLVEAIVANAFELGPRAALTGPVARGDVDTVVAQLAAVRASAPGWEQAFLALVGELARLAGRGDLFEHLESKGSPP